MNKMRKYVVMLGLVIIANFLAPLATNAQVAPDPGCDPLDPACPIDGGLSLLIAAGIGIGAKKAYDSRKKGVHKI
jgi:hypothetical protein